jgi:hypothetical protein
VCIGLQICIMPLREHETWRDHFFLILLRLLHEEVVFGWMPNRIATLN